MTSLDPVLELENISYRIKDRDILQGLDLSLNSGSSVAIMGPSGSGKSTLLSICLGLIRPDSGQARVAGQDITRLSARKLAELRSAQIGVIFQFGELLPEITPLDNIALPALLAARERGSAYARASVLMQDMGLDFGGAPTAQISGGERQRVAVARALINSPQLILADEPTGSLDEENRESVAEQLFELPKSSDCGLLVVTHDPSIAARADQVLHLVKGRLQ